MSKARKCGNKACRKPATGGNAVQVWCSVECAVVIAKSAQTKKRDREAKDQRERIKTRREVLSECQAAFNAWIRARDHYLPCVSCGRPNDGHHQRHAGHYRSVGSSPAIRFHPDNCHAQCATCNNHLSGNLIPYRAELVRRIGLERLEFLEGNHEPAKLTRDDLLVMRANFRVMAREATKSIANR